MKYQEALKKMKQILASRPNFIIGGSMGLILQGAIKERDVHDLDFCVNVDGCLKKSQHELNTMLHKCSISFDVDYPKCTGNDYVCVNANDDRVIGTAYYDLFLRERTKTITIWIDGKEFMVQHEDEIIEYKKEWNRTKDQEDLLPIF